MRLAQRSFERLPVTEGRYEAHCRDMLFERVSSSVDGRMTGQKYAVGGGVFAIRRGKEC